MLRVIIAAAVAAIASSQVQASTYNYGYTGNPYDTFTSDLDPRVPNPYIGHYVTAGFQLDAPLPPNALSLTINPVDWIISDQLITVTAFDTHGGASGSFEFTTDKNGKIVGWDVSAGLCCQNFSVSTSTGVDVSVQEFFTGSTNNPGKWTEITSPTQTPLPAALPLFGAGLAGLGWLVRRRTQS